MTVSQPIKQGIIGLNMAHFVAKYKICFEINSPILQKSLSTTLFPDCEVTCRLIRDFAVELPCKLGCSGLNYCANFNRRPTELFRSCHIEADSQARHDVQMWYSGALSLPLLQDLPVKGERRQHLHTLFLPSAGIGKIYMINLCFAESIRRLVNNKL